MKHIPKYKYIIQITFHIVKQSHLQLTSKDISLLFILFICQIRFCFSHSTSQIYAKIYSRIF